jgi:hypothetical protein
MTPIKVQIFRAGPLVELLQAPVKVLAVPGRLINEPGPYFWLKPVARTITQRPEQGSSLARPVAGKFNLGYY